MTSGFLAGDKGVRACADLPQVVDFEQEFNPNRGINARTNCPWASLRPRDGLHLDHLIGECVDLPWVAGSYYKRYCAAKYLYKGHFHKIHAF